MRSRPPNYVYTDICEAERRCLAPGKYLRDKISSILTNQVSSTNTSPSSRNSILPASFARTKRYCRYLPEVVQTLFVLMKRPLISERVIRQFWSPH